MCMVMNSQIRISKDFSLGSKLVFPNDYCPFPPQRLQKFSLIYPRPKLIIIPLLSPAQPNSLLFLRTLSPIPVSFSTYLPELGIWGSSVFFVFFILHIWLDTSSVYSSQHPPFLIRPSWLDPRPYLRSSSSLAYCQWLLQGPSHCTLKNFLRYILQKYSSRKLYHVLEFYTLSFVENSSAHCFLFLQGEVQTS